MIQRRNGYYTRKDDTFNSLRCQNLKTADAIITKRIIIGDPSLMEADEPTVTVNGEPISNDKWTKIVNITNVTQTFAASIFGIGASGSTGPYPNPVISINPTGGVEIFVSGATGNGVDYVTGAIIHQIDPVHGSSLYKNPNNTISYVIDNQNKTVKGYNASGTNMYNHNWELGNMKIGKNAGSININAEGNSNQFLLKDTNDIDLFRIGGGSLQVFDTSGNNVLYIDNAHHVNISGTVAMTGTSSIYGTLDILRTASVNGKVSIDPSSNSQFSVRNVNDNRRTFEIGNLSTSFFDYADVLRVNVEPNGTMQIFNTGLNIFNGTSILSPRTIGLYSTGMQVGNSDSDKVLEILCPTRAINMSGTVNISGTLSLNGVAVGGGGGGVVYDQSLNTTDITTFASLNIINGGTTKIQLSSSAGNGGQINVKDSSGTTKISLIGQDANILSRKMNGIHPDNYAMFTIASSSIPYSAGSSITILSTSVPGVLIERQSTSDTHWFSPMTYDDGTNNIALFDMTCTISFNIVATYDSNSSPVDQALAQLKCRPDLTVNNYVFRQYVFTPNGIRGTLSISGLRKITLPASFDPSFSFETPPPGTNTTSGSVTIDNWDFAVRRIG